MRALPPVLLALLLAAVGASWALFADAPAAAPPGGPGRAPDARVLPDAPAFAPIDVGEQGNEPLVLVGQDGTIYVSALQHLYRSTDGGASFRLVTDFLDHLSLASDSSLAMDPAGRLYYAAGWPYAGATEVCVSDDRGDSWLCNRVAMPAPTDRMWVVAPRADLAYLVTNVGLYQTVLLRSTDGGLTWIPQSTTARGLAPQTGPLLPAPDGSLLQPVKSAGFTLYAHRDGAPMAPALPVPLPSPLALPSAAFDAAGNLYAVSETVTPEGGRALALARRADSGAPWDVLAVPTPGLGTVTLSWVAAGQEGRVGVLFLASEEHGAPGSMTGARWGAYWAHTRDATAGLPTWTVEELDPFVHEGHVCIAAGCADGGRFAGDFISAAFGPDGSAHVAWMSDADAAQATVRYARLAP